MSIKLVNDILKASDKSLKDVYYELLEVHYRNNLDDYEKVYLNVLYHYFSKEPIEIDNILEKENFFVSKYLDFDVFLEKSEACIPTGYMGKDKPIKEMNFSNGCIVNIIKVDFINKRLYTSRKDLMTKVVGFIPFNLTPKSILELQEDTFELSKKYFKLLDKKKAKKVIEDKTSFIDHSPDYEKIIMNAIRNGDGDKYGF